MAANGYITHAAENRRKLVWLIAAYIVAIEILAAAMLTLILAFVDPGHILFVDPAGYALRYAGPVALFAGAIFWIIYQGHLKDVVVRLNIVIVTGDRSGDAQAARFVRIAEQMCTLAGIRRAQFGIIDAAQPNALSAGASSNAGLVAVTRGLLDALDDDELAAVIAHQAAHIRGGDTKIAAANHALMRTSVNFQVNNPLRIEDWRQALLVLALPFFLPVLLIGGATTMLAMHLSYGARRGIALSRDFIADAEAVRITHFPAALISAIEKTGGKGDFANSERVRGLLFCGGGASDVLRHAPVKDRVRAITTLGASMMADGRLRTDTRPARKMFGAPTPVPVAPLRAAPAEWTAFQPPPLSLLFASPTEYRQLYQRFVDAWEWQEGEARNVFGVSPKGLLPLGFAIAILVGLHWPSDNDFGRAVQIINPAQVTTLITEVNGGFSIVSKAGEEVSSTPATGNGRAILFAGVSPDAVRLQTYLTMLIVLGLAVAGNIPGLKEHINPNAAWAKMRKDQARADKVAPPQRPVAPADPTPPRSGQAERDTFTARLERELAALSHQADQVPEPVPARETPRQAIVDHAPPVRPTFGAARPSFGRKLG